MGIEAFGVSLRASQIFEYTHLARVGGVLCAEFRQQNEDKFTLVAEYGIIEGLRTYNAHESEHDLSVRFAICNPEKIDQLFLQFVSNIGGQYKANAWLHTSALANRKIYGTSEFHLLTAVLPEEIAALRKKWQSMFGSEVRVASVADAYKVIGQPCENDTDENDASQP